MRYLLLFLAGGAAYLLLELLWRGHTHWSMGVAGGFALLLLYLVFARMGPGLFVLKCFIGALLITTVEFTSGAVVNVALGWRVWDYSALKYNAYGQICLAYSMLWALLSLPVALVCQWLAAM